MFQQSNMAGHQSWRNKAKDLPEGKIPGHHSQDRPQRQISDEATFGTSLDSLIGQKAFSVFGIIAATNGTLHSFSHRSLDRLAHFQHHQLRTFIFFFFEKLRCSQRFFRAVWERGKAMHLER